MVTINRKLLFTRNFGDDQLVLAQDSFDLEFMLKRRYSAYADWCLQVNLKNTEFLVV